jgi:hypothetical protein
MTKLEEIDLPHGWNRLSRRRPPTIFIVQPRKIRAPVGLATVARKLKGARLETLLQQ